MAAPYARTDLFPKPPFARMGATTTFVNPPAGTLVAQQSRGYSAVKGLWR